jgi:hypothetical protein
MVMVSWRLAWPCACDGSVCVMGLGGLHVSGMSLACLWQLLPEHGVNHGVNHISVCRAQGGVRAKAHLSSQSSPSTWSTVN